MSQTFTPLLNKAISDTLNSTVLPPDSLSVRLINLEAQNAYVKLYGIAWGLVTAAEAALNDFDFAVLQILRNEVFDPDFQYGGLNAIRSKDVVFEDVIIREQKFNYIDFATPMELREASNYLIVMNAPINIAIPNTNYDCVLSVRGEFCKRDVATIRDFTEAER